MKFHGAQNITLISNVISNKYVYIGFEKFLWTWKTYFESKNMKYITKQKNLLYLT